MNGHQKKRLIYCRTPLQSLLVKAIQRQDPAHDVLLYQPTSRSRKHQFYFSRMDGDEKHFVSLPDISSHFVTELATYFNIPKSVRGRRFDEYLVSSFDSIPFSLLARRKEAKIVTFDDGVLNLLPSEMSARIHSERWLHRLAKRAFGGRDSAGVVQTSCRHYSIFPPQLNLFRNCDIVPLHLFDRHRAERAQAKNISVLLGTYIPGFLDTPSAEGARSYEEVVNSPEFDLFIPHPADSRPARISERVPELGWLVDAVEDSIAEDLVFNLIDRGYHITLCGIASTVLAILAPHAKTGNILIPGLNDAEAHIFDALGVESIDPQDLSVFIAKGRKEAV